MMVPANRLLGLAAVLGFGAALLAVALPAAALPALVVVAAAILAAALDAAISQARLRSVDIAFGEGQEAVPVFRMTRDREGAMALRVSHACAAAMPLRLGLALPPGCESAMAAMDVALAPDTPTARLAWTCTPRIRGRFPIEGVYLETPSALGLWLMRARRDARATLAVFPNTERERSRVAALFLRRGGVGMHAQRQVGKGREFEQLREYIPGDALEDLHWKATARRATPITKVYRVERTQEVYAVIDAARFSARGMPDSTDTQLELAMNAALVLGMAAERQGDRFGLAVFSDRLEKLVPAGHGRPHYQACREALYTLQPRLTHPDFGEVFSALRLRLRRRALLVFLTHLDDALLAESFAAHAPMLARRHLMGVFSVTQPSVRPVFSAPVKQPDEIYAHLSGHLQWHDQLELRRELHRHGIAMRAVPHASLTPEIVGHYLAVKRRQLL